MVQKLLPLESLRGVAALSVAVYHIEISTSITNSLFIRHANWFVDFFFILSGFVIAYSYLDRLNCIQKIIQFQKRRFWRLYPLHLVTLVAFLGIELVRVGALKFFSVNSNIVPFEQNNLQAFASNLFLLQSFYPSNPSFNYPSWSISTEFYTYLVFAIVIYTARKYFVLASVLIVVIAYSCHVFILAYLDQIGHETSQFRFLRCLIGFFLGVLLFSVYDKFKTQRSCPEFVWLAFLALTVVCIAFSDSIPKPLIYFAFSGLILSVLYVRASAVSISLISTPALVHLGTISYSIYMLHAAVWWTFNQALRFGLKVPTVDMPGRGEIYQMEPGWGIVYLVFCVVLLLGVSQLSYHHIEKRFKNGIHRNSLVPIQQKKSDSKNFL